MLRNLPDTCLQLFDSFSQFNCSIKHRPSLRFGAFQGRELGQVFGKSSVELSRKARLNVPDQTITGVCVTRFYLFSCGFGGPGPPAGPPGTPGTLFPPKAPMGLGQIDDPLILAPIRDILIFIVVCRFNDCGSRCCSLVSGQSWFNGEQRSRF